MTNNDTWYQPYVYDAYIHALSEWPFYPTYREAWSRVCHLLSGDEEFLGKARTDHKARGIRFSDDWSIGGYVDHYTRSWASEIPSRFKSLLRGNECGSDAMYWFAPHVFNAFVQAISEQPAKFFVRGAGYMVLQERVATLLAEDENFQQYRDQPPFSPAHIFQPRYAARTIEFHIAHYLKRYARSPEAMNSPYNTKNLNALIANRRSMPCEPGEMRLILDRLPEALAAERAKGEGTGFPTYQSASAAVVMLLQKDGITHLDDVVVRRAITWTLNAMPQYVAELREMNLPNMDAREYDDAVRPETSTTRVQHGSTGGIGSTQGGRRKSPGM